MGKDLVKGLGDIIWDCEREERENQDSIETFVEYMQGLWKWVSSRVGDSRNELLLGISAA